MFTIETVMVALLGGSEKGAHGGRFVGHDLRTWLPVHYLIFIALVVGCKCGGWVLRPEPPIAHSYTPLTTPHATHATVSALLDRLCFFVCERVLRLALIPNTGKHLDELSLKDHLYVAWNRYVFSCGWMFFVSRPNVHMHTCMHGGWVGG